MATDQGVKHPFAIVGRPRSRTAWLAAWLCACGVPTIHEPTLGSKDLPSTKYGLSGPDLLLVHNLRDRVEKIVLIDRPAKETQPAWESFLGTKLSPLVHKKVEKHFRDLRSVADAVHTFKDLDNFCTVDAITRFLTGRPADETLFASFSRLLVVQHLNKAKEVL